jgi:hypothetical protein
VKDVAPIDHEWHRVEASRRRRDVVEATSYTCVEVLMRFFSVVSLFAVVRCGSDTGKPTQFVVPEGSRVAGTSAPAPRAPVTPRNGMLPGRITAP